jgi:hypothetical protein
MFGVPDLRTRNSAPQGTGVSEDAVLERSERMLNRRSWQAHHLWGGSLLHPLQRAVMQMTVYEPLRRVGAARLQRTATTYFDGAGINNTMFVSLISFLFRPA